MRLASLCALGPHVYSARLFKPACVCQACLRASDLSACAIGPPTCTGPARMLSVRMCARSVCLNLPACVRFACMCTGSASCLGPAFVRWTRLCVLGSPMCFRPVHVCFGLYVHWVRLLFRTCLRALDPPACYRSVCALGPYV